MSLTAAEYKARRNTESKFYHRLVNLHSLESQAVQWLRDHGKEYGAETLGKFNVQQGTLQRHDRQLGFGSRSFVCADPVIVIPVGLIFRCYRFLEPLKSERWHVVPAGHGAQWVGDLSFPELIICEGEWDLLKLHDLGFENAVTHTAGAGTWLPKWSQLFAGKKVSICFDRDRVGQQGAAKVAQNLFPVVKEVRLVDLPLPGTPEANDISDFFRLGGSPNEFRELLGKARPYIPAVRAAGRRSGLYRRRLYAHRI